MLCRENFKLNSSEMARNRSKTVKSEVNFLVLIKQRVTNWPSLLTKFQ